MQKQTDGSLAMAGDPAGQRSNLLIIYWEKVTAETCNLLQKNKTKGDYHEDYNVCGNLYRLL